MNIWVSKASIDNPKWKYRPSFDTDVKRTITRVKREMKAIEEQQAKKAKRVR